MFVHKYLCLIICIIFPSLLESLYININYSFKLPEIAFGQGILDESKCCPYIINPINDTSNLQIPDFMLIGVPKAGINENLITLLFFKNKIITGTSELSNILRSHPMLQLSQNKELHWMDGDGIM